MKCLNQFSALSAAQRLVIHSSNLGGIETQASRALWHEVEQSRHRSGGECRGTDFFLAHYRLFGSRKRSSLIKIDKSI